MTTYECPACGYEQEQPGRCPECDIELEAQENEEGGEDDWELGDEEEEFKSDREESVL